MYQSVQPYTSRFGCSEAITTQVDALDPCTDGPPRMQSAWAVASPKRRAFCWPQKRRISKLINRMNARPLSRLCKWSFMCMRSHYQTVCQTVGLARPACGSFRRINHTWYSEPNSGPLNKPLNAGQFAGVRASYTTFYSPETGGKKKKRIYTREKKTRPWHQF